MASSFPGSELQVGFRADVARADAMVSDCDSRGLMGSECQQDERVCRGDNRRTGAAHCFVGPELQAEFRADVA